jgi:hypothetical protein
VSKKGKRPVFAPGDPDPLRLAVAGRCSGIRQHALLRYHDRSGTCAGITTKQVLHQIQSRLANAEEMWLRPERRVRHMARHPEPAAYFRHRDLLFVIVNDIIVTIHNAMADKWWSQRPE